MTENPTDDRSSGTQLQQPDSDPAGLATGRIRGIIIGVIALLVVIGVVVWLTVGRSSGPVDPAAPSGNFGADAWGEPIPLDMNYMPTMTSVGVDNVLVVVSRFSTYSGARGINVDTGSIIWTKVDKFGVTFGGDSTGYVLPTENHLLVIDPSTGATIGEGDISEHDEVLWAGNGFILTDNDAVSEMCARTMSNPGVCVWYAPDILLNLSYDPNADMRSEYVFGDGKWVNTGAGVRELATGKRVNFGNDAGWQDETNVSFTGSAGRVFRVISDGYLAKFQPWDTDTDEAISPVVFADYVVANAASPVYLAYGSSGGSDTVTAYEWATGKQMWQKRFLSTEGSPGLLTGGYWINDYGNKVTAYDELTGNVKWHNNNMHYIGGVRDGYVYTMTDSQLKVVDPARRFAVVQQAQLPSWSGFMLVLPHAVCFIDGQYDPSLYVLHA